MVIPVVIALAAGLGGCRNSHSYSRAAFCYFPTRTRSVYLVVGGGSARETYGPVENTGGFAEGGIGHRRKVMGSELDLRLAYQALLNSDNAGHVVMRTVHVVDGKTAPRNEKPGGQQAVGACTIA